MAGLTSSQDIARGKFSPYVPIGILEKFILNILRRFRFCEIGKVVSIDINKLKVRCELVYRVQDEEKAENRITRWIPVHSIFASVNEGIIAMPNIGDYGIVFFRLADICGGFFLSASWGKKSIYPETHQKLQEKDLLVKRNGSWAPLIDKEGDIELFHKRQNQLFMSEGYNRVNAVETGTEENYYNIRGGVAFQQQKMSNQHINRSLGKEFRVAAFEKTKNISIEGGLPGSSQTLLVERVRVPTNIDGEVISTGNPLDQTAFTTYRAPEPIEIEVASIKKSYTRKSNVETFCMERTIEIRQLSTSEKIYPVSGKILRQITDIYTANQYEFEDAYGRKTYGLIADRKRISASGTDHEVIYIWGDVCRIRVFSVNPSGEVDSVVAGNAEQKMKEEKEYMRFELDEFDNLSITDDICAKILGTIPDYSSYSSEGSYNNNGSTYTFVQQDHTKLNSEK